MLLFKQKKQTTTYIVSSIFNLLELINLACQSKLMMGRLDLDKGSSLHPSRSFIYFKADDFLHNLLIRR